jgi:hypothetical protein
VIDERKLTAEQAAILDVLAPRWKDHGVRIAIFEWGHGERPTDEELIVITDNIIESLNKVAIKRQFGEDTIVVTFDGQVVAVHGEVVANDNVPGGTLFTYRCRTVEDALRLHHAWDKWTDARMQLTAKSSRRARDHVEFLKNEFKRLEEELET